jgi:large subunit ribosomal protein L17
MHRHGYKGRKFGRETDQRTALIKGLADALITHHSIETTVDKAKELRPYVEKLVTKAKKQDLHNRRQIISSVATKKAAHKLVDQIAPALGARNSGYLRITRTRTRRGDNAQMASIAFVDDVSVVAAVTAPVAKAKTVKPKKEAVK